MKIKYCCVLVALSTCWLGSAWGIGGGADTSEGALCAVEAKPVHITAQCKYVMKPSERNCEKNVRKEDGPGIYRIVCKRKVDVVIAENVRGFFSCKQSSQDSLDATAFDVCNNKKFEVESPFKDEDVSYDVYHDEKDCNAAKQKYGSGNYDRDFCKKSQTRILPVAMHLGCGGCTQETDPKPVANPSQVGASASDDSKAGGASAGYHVDVDEPKYDPDQIS